MRFGMRMPSFKKSFKAKTTGSLKRSIKRKTNFAYGKKGTGFLKDPKRSIYNKVYNKTTFSPTKLGSGKRSSTIKHTNNSPNAKGGCCLLNILLLPFWIIYYIVKAICSLFSPNKRVSPNPEKTEIQSQNYEDFQKPKRESSPLYTDEYVKAIFLWANSKPSPIKNDDYYPRYFIYKYGIEHPSEYHKKLLQEGYYKTSTIEERLSLLKVTQLKDLLDKIGQKKTEKKDDLITTVIKFADNETIDNYCPDSYSLTDLGKQFINEHSRYIEEHKNIGVISI